MRKISTKVIEANKKHIQGLLDKKPICKVARDLDIAYVTLIKFIKIYKLDVPRLSLVKNRKKIGGIKQVRVDHADYNKVNVWRRSRPAKKLFLRTDYPVTITLTDAARVIVLNFFEYHNSWYFAPEPKFVRAAVAGGTAIEVLSDFYDMPDDDVLQYLKKHGILMPIRDCGRLKLDHKRKQLCFDPDIYEMICDFSYTRGLDITGSLRFIFFDFFKREGIL